MFEVRKQAIVDLKARGEIPQGYIDKPPGQ